MARFDFFIRGVVNNAETEEEARAILHRRLVFGPKGMGDPVHFDEDDAELEQVR